ncbi:glycosyltransferase family 4 protein [Bacillus sp. DJP31]|uniref:glycosyltransferase family 4 protein n=1 Tax=Bacillus sp. DJP31 TaxID=3409789 RepID=UPI003BB53254
MKIAIFTDTFAPQVNGVARTLKRFTDYLEQQEIEYKVFAPDCTKDEELFSTHIHRFTSLPFFLYPECRLALPNMLHVKSQLQQFQPDIIHVATPFNVGLCGIHYAKKLNIPLVGSYHTDFDQYLEYYDLQFLSPILWKYMRWFHRSFLKTFVPSQETKEQLKRHGFTDLHIWSRGVDSALYKPNEHSTKVREKYKIKEKYVLSYVGRLAPEKDVQTLLETMKALPPNLQKNVRWLVVGDGPSKLDMQRETPSNVTFTGYLNGKELSEVYAASDLFVFPSPTETFGNVVLEALACGTPVVGANSGGVKNIIRQGKTGILCEPKKVESFVEAIVDLLENNEKRTHMSTEARVYSMTQTWSAIFNNLLDEYEMAIHESKETKYAKII